MLILNIQNADELVKLMEQHKLLNFPCWRIRVDHNPYGEGSPTWLRACIHSIGDLDTFFKDQDDIDGIDYEHISAWHTRYTGTFQLDTTPFQNIKPEIYKIGDTVEVLEVVKDCWGFSNWPDAKKELVGKKHKIKLVYDTYTGIYYSLSISLNHNYVFPHYAVRKVVDFAELEPKAEVEKKTVTLELTDEQLEKIKEVLEN
jgi:hypothetical protein